MTGLAVSRGIIEKRPVRKKGAGFQCTRKMINPVKMTFVSNDEEMKRSCEPRAVWLCSSGGNDSGVATC